MRIKYALFSVALLSMVLMSCDTTTGSNGGESLKTITGTVTVPDSLKSFVVIVAGTADSVWVWNTDDEVTSVSGANSPFAMLVKTSTPAGSNSRDYTLDLADDPETFGTVIAFVDRNGNGLLDFPGEETRLPVKSIDGSDEVIWSWGYLTVGSDSQYLVAYGMGNNVGLDIVGTDGFNFSF